MNTVVAPIHWSYSSLKNFEGCPQRYYQERETGALRQAPTEQSLYGTRLHEAAEAFFKEGKPIADEFKPVVAVLNALMQLPGTQYSELDLSLRKDLTPCDENDPDVWLKAFADFVVVNGKRALVNDFKTGNWRYADMDQLELYALCIFQHFPEVEEVRGMLLFVKDDKPFKKVFHQRDAGEMWARWVGRINKIAEARVHNRWPTKPSGLCRYCPHTRCLEHPSWRF